MSNSLKSLPAGDPTFSSMPADSAEAAKPSNGLAEPLPALSVTAADHPPAEAASAFDIHSSDGVRAVRISWQEKLARHPAAVAWPRVSSRYNRLYANIKVHGVLKPIYVLVGKNGKRTVFDGICRLDIAQELRFDCPALEFPEENLRGSNIVDIIKSLNEHSRNLSKAQNAMVAARSIEPYRKAAALRRAHKASCENSQEQANDEGNATQIVGRMFGVGRNMVEAAARVIEQGPAALADAIDDGYLNVFNAAALLALSKEDIARAVRAARKGEKQTVAALIAKAKNELVKAANVDILSVANRVRELGCQGRHYSTIHALPCWEKMTVAALAAVEVQFIAGNDAVLFLWAPASIEPAVALCAKWGFKVVDTVVATCQSFATGHCFQHAHRTCLVATRGKPILARSNLQSWFESNGNGHYAISMRDRCVLSGPGPYLQLFGEPHDDEQWTVLTHLLADSTS